MKPDTSTSNTNINVNVNTNLNVSTSTSTSINVDTSSSYFNTVTLDYVGLSNWSTDIDFMLVDKFVREQFPQVRNSQVVAVWVAVQVNVATNYKIQYVLNGRTVQFIVNKIKDSTRMTIVSNTLTMGFQPFTKYATSADFKNADEFSRSQLIQLKDAKIIAVWVQFSSGVSYRVQYNTVVYGTVEVIISYNSTTDSYTFELISPLSLLPFILKPDPLCKTFRRNFCTECAFRSVFDNNRRCKEVNKLCNQYETATGKCTSCYGGYTLSNGACVTTSSLLPPNCAYLEGGVCT